jgi:ribosomal protein S18 acetylase RimI-like enzyme
VQTHDLQAATARNLAGWHEVHVRALGLPTEHVDGLWLTTSKVPVIFFSAIGLEPEASAATAAGCLPLDHWVAVSDPWADLRLDVHGFTPEPDQGWMVRLPRPAGAVSAAGPAELQIERVEDADALWDFELAGAAGFGTAVQPRATWHAPAILRDATLTILRGRVDGQTVATSMSYRHAGILGIYGVSTLPAARRRGYATAMTVAALDLDPAIPAVLQPSQMAVSLYGRLGFERFATFRSWARMPTLSRVD